MFNSNKIPHILDEIAVRESEMDQAQAMIDDARKLPLQTEGFVRRLDELQIELNVKRAKLKSVKNHSSIRKLRRKK